MSGGIDPRAVAPFQLITGIPLTRHQQMGLWLAQIQDVSVEHGVARLYSPTKDGDFRAATVRPDKGDPGQSFCTLHRSTGFPRTRCACHWAREYTLSPPDPRVLVPYSDQNPQPEPPPLLLPGTDFHIGKLPRIVKTYTEDRLAYVESRSLSVRDFLVIAAMLESLIETPLRKQFGRDPYALGRYVRMTLTREFFCFTYREVESFFIWLHEMGLIDDRFATADTLCKWERTPEAPEALLALNRRMVRVFAPIHNGFCAIDGSGFGGAVFFRYLTDVAKLLQKMADGESLTTEQQERLKKIHYKAHVVMAADLDLMVDMTVTEAHGDEKEQARLLLARLDPEWPAKQFGLDGGYDDGMVRDAVVEAGATPLVKWKRTHKRAISEKLQKSGAIKNPDVIEATYLYAKANPEEFLNAYNQRWREEGAFGAVKEKYFGYVGSHCVEGARTQIISKFVCDTIDHLAFAWRYFGIDQDVLGVRFDATNGKRKGKGKKRL